MTTQKKQIFTLNPHYTFEEFNSELFLYSVHDAKGLYLNTTACVVWKLCAEQQSLENIIALLEKKYPKQKGDVRKDVTTTIESLVQNGVLTVTDG